jgi:hypothetical protein
VKIKTFTKKGGLAYKRVSAELPDIDMLAEALNIVSDEFPFKEIEDEVIVIDNTVRDIEEKLILGEEILSEEEKDELYEELIIAKKRDSISLVEAELIEIIRQDTQAQETWGMMKADFPTLSEEQITENIELINEYYLRNLDYVILEEVATNGEEVANKVAKKRSLHEKVTLDGAQCGGLSAFLLSGSLLPVVGNIASVINVKRAGDNANAYAANRYRGYSGANDRRDAFRHLVWNALMAKYHVSLIPSIGIRTDLATRVANAYESCGGNDEDASKMDSHNNLIGRRIYRNNTSYKRFLAVLVGLNEPSNTRILQIARNFVEDESCYIVKFPEIPQVGNKKPDLSIPQVVSYINNTDSNTVVYFRGAVAHCYVRVFSYWDFSDPDCGGGYDMKRGKQAYDIDGSKPQKVCPYPRYKNIERPECYILSSYNYENDVPKLNN